MMINIVGSEHQARELLQEVILFVGGASRSDYADGRAAIAIAHFFELTGDQFECCFPCRRLELAVGGYAVR